MTVAKLISMKNKPFEHGKKYCVIVDETSMGDSRTINELLKITQEYKAKVIFVGDKDQFLPVGAGKFFSDLQKTDVKITTMKDVIRQKTTQTKRVAKALADKEIPAAINHLAGFADVTGYDKTNAKKYAVGQRISFHSRTAALNSAETVPAGTTARVAAVGDAELTIEYTVNGRKITVNIDPRQTHKNYTLYEKNNGYKNCIHTVADKNVRLQAVAADYVYCLENGTDALVITATNEYRRSLNTIIRETRVRQGKIKNIGEFTLLEPKNVKSFIFADSFAVGQHIKGLPQLKTDGEHGFGEITNIDPNQNKITVRNITTNEEFKIDPSDYVKKQFSVFDKTESELGVGEKIAFLKNAKVTDRNTGKTVNLRNGQLASVTALDKAGNITVNVDKKEITFNLKDYNYLTTAFALSLHKSQGMTVDKVIWHADTQKEVSMNSFYVAVTRCKRDIAVYTDDVERLQMKAVKGQEKYSTVDVDEIYEKTYQQHRENLQKREREAAQPDTAPAADSTAQTAAPPPKPDTAPPIQEAAPPTKPDAVPPIQETAPPTKPDAVPPTQETAPPPATKNVPMNQPNIGKYAQEKIPGATDKDIADINGLVRKDIAKNGVYWQISTENHSGTETHTSAQLRDGDKIYGYIVTQKNGNSCQHFAYIHLDKQGEFSPIIGKDNQPAIYKNIAEAQWQLEYKLAKEYASPHIKRLKDTLSDKRAAEAKQRLDALKERALIELGQKYGGKAPYDITKTVKDHFYEWNDPSQKTATGYYAEYRLKNRLEQRTLCVGDYGIKKLDKDNFEIYGRKDYWNDTPLEKYKGSFEDLQKKLEAYVLGNKITEKIKQLEYDNDFSP
ncbi:hypothetical protein R80B4_01260 [Fibrobacteres bacterium R8-0-B4]